MLAHRSRSREELRRRLSSAGYEPEEIETALEDLERVDLVDDERFAREMAAYQMGSKSGGARLALNALRQAGIDRTLAERVVAEMAPEDEEAQAEEVARSRLTRLGRLDDATAYRRLVSFLQRKGYDSSVCRAAAERAIASESRS